MPESERGVGLFCPYELGSQNTSYKLGLTTFFTGDRLVIEISAIYAFRAIANNYTYLTHLIKI